MNGEEIQSVEPFELYSEAGLFLSDVSSPLGYVVSLYIVQDVLCSSYESLSKIIIVKTIAVI